MTSYTELRASKIGTTFNNLTALEYVGGRRGLYKFACSCGNETTVPFNRVKAGEIKSCGCWQKGRPVTEGNRAPNKAVWHRYRLSAKHRNLEFALTEEEVEHLTEQDCSYCGAEPSTEMKLSAHPNFKYTGIDRVDNSIGYIVSNCVPCCKICNQSKHSLTKEEWKTWLHRIAAKYQGEV